MTEYRTYNGMKNKTPNYHLDASRKYDNKLDNIRLRLPAGYNQLMKDYISEHSEYSSVNDLIRKLIEEKLEINNDHVL